MSTLRLSRWMIQGITPKQVIDTIAVKYQFANRPRPNPVFAPFGIPGGAMGAAAVAGGMQVMVQAPMTLQNGVARIGEQQIPISRMDLTQDISQIAVHTITTDEADMVLDDLTDLLEAACGFRNIKETAKRQYASNDCGRDVHYWTPPAQIRTCGFPAYGSHLGCLTAKRSLGQG